MASDYRLIIDGATIYLHNSTGAPVVGGSLAAADTTPLVVVDDDWTPGAADATLATAGDDQTIVGVVYDAVEETIPLLCRASSTNNLVSILQSLNLHDRRTTEPAVLWARPNGAANAALFAVERIDARAIALDAGRQPGEGATDVAIRLALRRSAQGGEASLTTLASAVSVGNTGTGSPANLISLGTLAGDLRMSGQPLVVSLSKPAGQSPTTVVLASCVSRAYRAIASAKTTTTSIAFAASSSVDVSALRSRAGLHLHLAARLTTLTSPTKALVRARVQTASGAALWDGPWVPLQSATTAQYVDLGGSALDAIRTPLGAAASIVVVVELASIDGTSVTATLDAVEAILAYDWCVVSLAAALATGQKLQLFGAQCVANGPWLPQSPPIAVPTDGSDVRVGTAWVAGAAPRAIVGASLYVAWVDAGGAHTASDTTTCTIQHAPLYRTTRGT